MYSKLLVPLDGSPTAEVALEYAVGLAKLTGAEVVVLRVAADPGAEFAFSDPSIAATLVKKMEVDTQNYMDGVTKKLSDGGIKASCLIREGPIAETILEVADEIGADTFVMSTHGRTGPARWLMGSIADKVVRGSKKPVLLIRPH